MSRLPTPSTQTSAPPVPIFVSARGAAKAKRPPTRFDPASIVGIVFLAINIAALVAFVAVCVRNYNSFRLYVNTANDIVSYAVQQGTATVTRFGTDVGNDADNIKSLFLKTVGNIELTGRVTPVRLEPCKPGWHNDGLTCRKPIKCHTHHGLVHCSGGQVVGRLNHGGCCPCGRFLRAGLCFQLCPPGYDPLFWPFTQVCMGREDATAATATSEIAAGFKPNCPEGPLIVPLPDSSS